MAIYRFICPNCENVEEKMVVFDKRNDQTCSECNKPTEYKPTYMFSAQGLPNGFSATRSSSREKKHIGDVNTK